MVIPRGSLYCEAMTEPLQTAPTLLTIGYESADLDAFLATLSEHGVTLLVDTRERAQSRRRGYSKTALSTALAEQNIDYRHLRDLGTPPGIRKAYKLDRDFAALRAGYTLHLATQGVALEELGTLAARKRVCLLCYEAEAQECHRSLIAARLREMGLVGAVEDLMVPARTLP